MLWSDSTHWKPTLTIISLMQQQCKMIRQQLMHNQKCESSWHNVYNRIKKKNFECNYCINLKPSCFISRQHAGMTRYWNNLIHIIIIVNWAACPGAMVGEGRGNGELVIMKGRNGQMVAFWLESILIGRPGQSEFLAFGGDPVRRSSVGVAINIVVSGFSVWIVTWAFHFLLDLRFLAGRVIRSRVTVIILAKKDFFKVNCIMFTPIVR